MFSLIPQIILLLCFGLIVWLIIKNLPKVKDEEGGTEHNVEAGSLLNKKRKFIHKIPIEKIDAKVNSFLEKVLRRSRIILMRVDTYLQKHLDTLKSHSKPKTIFKADDNLIAKEEINIDNVQQQDEFKNPEGDIELITGVDKNIDESLPKPEKTVNLNNKVDVLIIGKEEVVKKFDLDPNVEVVVQKKKTTRRPRKTKVAPQLQKERPEEKSEEV